VHTGQYVVSILFDHCQGKVLVESTIVRLSLPGVTRHISFFVRLLKQRHTNEVHVNEILQYLVHKNYEFSKQALRMRIFFSMDAHHDQLEITLKFLTIKLWLRVPKCPSQFSIY